MIIEIAEHERMSESGSSLLRLIQNQDIPLLDLFIREGIQNALDAAKDGVQYVNVNLITGKFYSNQLNNKLSGIEGNLNVRYPSK